MITLPILGFARKTCILPITAEGAILAAEWHPWPLAGK